jgi:hypothetical protein
MFLSCEPIADRAGCARSTIAEAPKMLEFAGVSTGERLDQSVAYIGHGTGNPKNGSMSYWAQHDVEQEFLELDDFCPGPAANFPPSVGVKV